MPYYPEVLQYQSAIRERNAAHYRQQLERQRQHGGKNYVPPVYDAIGRLERAASVECDCGALIMLHPSWEDCGTIRAAITIDCIDCGQHWRTPFGGPGSVGGFRAKCAGPNECPCDS